MDREILQLVQKTLVFGVLFIVQFEALCSLNWRIDDVARTIGFFKVVHEVDVRGQAVNSERRLIPIYDAERKRELVRLKLESISTRRVHCVNVGDLRILRK